MTDTALREIWREYERGNAEPFNRHVERVEQGVRERQAQERFDRGAWVEKAGQEVPWVARQPADCIDLRTQLVDWFKRDGEIQRHLAMQGRVRMPDTEDESWEHAAHEARAWYYNTLRLADLYWISPDMVQVLKALAPAMPDTYPNPPVGSALAILAKPMPGIDAHSGIVIHTAAYLWGPMLMKRRDPSIAVDTFGWRDFMEPRDAHGELWDETREQRWRSVMPTKLVLTGGSEWSITRPTSYVEDWLAQTDDARQSIIEDRRLIACLWSLFQQKLVRQSFEPGDRYATKRARRAGVENWLEAVRVIKLREIVHQRHDSGEEGTPVDWSCRWWVDGHHRMQWYPSAGEHRKIWIEPYIKGPDDKPLVIRPTVRALVR